MENAIKICRWKRTIILHLPSVLQPPIIWNSARVIYFYRPLSRRLDRCDRVIHNESGDPNGGNMCSFSGATCTSRVRHNADYVPYAKIRFDL